ncbi:MAG: uracil-DNA glycosylase family protein [Pseudomonadota bacterium]
MSATTEDLAHRIERCTLCAERFAATETRHSPRPVAWFRSGARLLIVGQAPGMRVHKSGKPFDDPSGERLRDWLGVTPKVFYDRDRVAIVPMAFCFPGYDARGADLPPPKLCAETWRADVMSGLQNVALTVVIGRYAQDWHLGIKGRDSVTATVRRWREFAPGAIVLPHPSWRNSGWLKRNPWFETDVLPDLRARVSEVLND